MNVLEVAGLRKTFPLPGTRGSTVTAVDDVSFVVPAGGAVGLVGESGSGKSTVARMLAGLTSPDAGTITVDGRSRVTPERGRKARPRGAAHERGRAARLRRAAEIQLVFQDPYQSLDPRLSAADCLRHALRLHGTTGRTELSSRVEELLTQVGLGTREADARPHRLSGGQRQRLAIARALAVRPALLVLDEAVSALDVSIQAQILQLLAAVRREAGVSLLFVSHDLAVIRQLTDHVLVMRQGRLVEEGPVTKVLTEPADPYTRLLLASVPRPGWDPAEATHLRTKLGEGIS